MFKANVFFELRYSIGKANPFYGMTDAHETWWMGTPRAEGGLVTWRGDNCDEVSQYEDLG